MLPIARHVLSVRLNAHQPFNVPEINRPHYIQLTVCERIRSLLALVVLQQRLGRSHQMPERQNWLKVNWPSVLAKLALRSRPICLHWSLAVASNRGAAALQRNGLLAKQCTGLIQQQAVVNTWRTESSLFHPVSVLNESCVRGDRMHVGLRKD